MVQSSVTNGLEAISVGAQTVMALGTTDTILWVIDESPAVFSQLIVRLEKQARRKIQSAYLVSRPVRRWTRSLSQALGII